MKEGNIAKTAENLTKEIAVTIHYAENGPALHDCMVSILGAHLSKGAGF